MRGIVDSRSVAAWGINSAGLHFDPVEDEPHFRSTSASKLAAPKLPQFVAISCFVQKIAEGLSTFQFGSPLAAKVCTTS